jgi:hypothetical protein
MPCYFFHIENGECLTDDEGEEFPDDQAALQEADLIAGRSFQKPNQSDKPESHRDQLQANKSTKSSVAQGATAQVANSS